MKLYPMCFTSWLHFSMDPLNDVYRHKSFHTFRMISGSFFWLIGSKCVQMKRWAASQFLKRVIWQNFFIAKSDLTECFDHFKTWSSGFEKQHLHLVRLLNLRLQHSSKFACKLENLKIIQLFTGDEFANEHGQSHATCSIYLESRLLISALPPVTHSCLTWFLWNRLLKTSTRLNSISDNWHSLQKIQ